MKLSKNELIQLAKLLDKNYSLSQCNEIMNLSLDLSTIDNFNIEKMLLKSIPKKYIIYVTFLIKVVPISSAILYAVEIVDEIDMMKQKLMKQSVYPLFIFVLSFITLLLFSNVVIPELLQSFDEIESNFIITLVYIIQWICIVLCLVLFIIFIIVFIMYFRMKEDKELYYRFFTLDVLKQWHSYMFITFYSILLNKGLSTKDALLCIQQSVQEKLMFHLVYDFNQRLKKGISFDEIISQTTLLSKMSKQYFIIGMYGSNVLDDLNNFLEAQRALWLQQIQYICIGLQVLSYSFVAILMICVYQIMLLPLEMFETM